MLSYTFITIIALSTSALATVLPRSCTSQQRLYHSQQIPAAYAQTGIQATYNAFAAIPFGVPNLAGACTTAIYPNGGSGVTVTNTGQGVVNFGTETRQVFSSVTGEYHDFGSNGTVLLLTNVTLGVQSEIDVPVTFTNHVYLDFNNDCRISAVRAYARIPTYVDGQPTELWKYLTVPETPLIL